MENPIVSKIRKLLALADDQEGTPEGELAGAKALGLMAQHAVTMAQLGREEDIIEEKVNCPTSNWIKELWWALAQHCQVKALHSKRLMILFGTRDDIEVTKYLHGICSVEINRKCGDYINGLHEDGLYGGKTEGMLFRRSAVVGLDAKLTEQREGLRREHASAALVLASRAQKAHDFAQTKYKITPVRLPSHAVKAAGYYAGYEMNVNRRIE